MQMSFSEINCLPHFLHIPESTEATEKYLSLQSLHKGSTLVLQPQTIHSVFPETIVKTFLPASIAKFCARNKYFFTSIYRKKMSKKEISAQKKINFYLPERAFFQREIVCKAASGVMLSGSEERISSRTISSSLKRPGATGAGRASSL